MATYQDTNELEYRPNGDTIDDFARKYMASMRRIYQFLNNIRGLNSLGTEYVEPEAYQMKAENGKLYIRNEDNSEWVFLGDVAYKFGTVSGASETILTSNQLSPSGGEAGKILVTDSDGNLDTNITGAAAKFGAYPITLGDDSLTNKMGLVFINGDFVPREVILKNDIASKGGAAGVIVKTNDAGKLDVDITGSPDKLVDYQIETAGIQDQEALVYFDGRWENKKVVLSSEVSVEEGAGKIPRANDDGILDYSISGNAGKLAGKTVQVTNPQDGQILAYRASLNAIVNEDRAAIGDAKALTLKQNGNVVAVYAGSTEEEVDFGATEEIIEKIYTHDRDPNSHEEAMNAHNIDVQAHTEAITAHNDNAEAHSAAMTAHNEDMQAHRGLGLATLKIQYNEVDQVSYTGAENKTLNITPAGIGASATSHTHNYAGSASAGGAANSAAKLTTDAGNANQAVYFSNGIPVACNLSAMLPTGAIIAHAASSTIPAGFFLCDGSAVSRTTYATLFSVIGTVYGAGNGSTTFNIPDLILRYMRGWNSSGETVNQGLPNIIGSAYGGQSTLSSPFYLTRTGALTGGPQVTYYYAVQTTTTTTDGRFGLGFNASFSNAIYGASNRVTPSTMNMRFLIKFN